MMKQTIHIRGSGEDDNHDKMVIFFITLMPNGLDKVAGKSGSRLLS